MPWMVCCRRAVDLDEFKSSDLRMRRLEISGSSHVKKSFVTRGGGLQSPGIQSRITRGPFRQGRNLRSAAMFLEIELLSDLAESSILGFPVVFILKVVRAVFLTHFHNC